LWVLGPYFFEDNEGPALTVTSDRHVEMLRNFCDPELRRRGIDLSSVWFQQDGATAHTARASMSVLREMFPQHDISRGGDIPCLTRSHDLSACDYFLWGYLKSKVFISKPKTTKELKEETAANPKQMARLVMEKRRERLEQCLRNCGRHLNDETFKNKMAYTEFFSDNNCHIIRWNVIVLFPFENRQVCPPHAVLLGRHMAQLLSGNTNTMARTDISDTTTYGKPG
jgi:hypothetical protein